ncbi:MAG: NifB/NifX family molybdenum-iron cluster-binding protein [Planctomycetota bacterium]
MKIAIPTVDGKVAQHFGHCGTFALYDVDPQEATINESTTEDPPPHEPGVLPRWLNQRGVDLILAGGMGRRAQNLFRDSGVDVIVGAPPEPPEDIIRLYLDDELQTGDNLCAH